MTFVRGWQVEMVPASSSLVMKALDEPVRNRKEEKNGEFLTCRFMSWLFMCRVSLTTSPGYATSVVHDGNITLDQVIEIARTMRERSLARELAGTVREILGTCFSIGCTVNGEHPRELSLKIKNGEVPIPAE